MFTASFLAGDFSGLPKSPPAPALAMHLLLSERQQRPQGSSLSLQTSCPSALWESWTPNPRTVTQVPCTSPSLTSMWNIRSNGNLDKGLVYSAVPCIPDSAKQEPHHKSRRETTHTPAPKEISLCQWNSPSKIAPQIEIWVSSCTGHLGPVYFSL